MSTGFDTRFELRHLRYVIAVAEAGGIRRAARRLGIDPGAVSRRLKDLEDEIGAALFIRGQSGVSLTFAGEQFLQRARRAVLHVGQAAQDAAAMGIGHQGVVRIGLISSLASGFLPHLIEAYRSGHPEVRLEYFEGGPNEHIPALQQHRLDVAFLTGQPVAEGCDIQHLWSERVYVAMSEKHELATLSEVEWPQLQGRHFVVSTSQPGPEITDYLIRHLSSIGHCPTIDRQAVSRDNLMQILTGGRCLTLTSEATIATLFPGVIYRPIVTDHLPFHAVWSPRNDNPAFRRFLSMAKVRSLRWMHIYGDTPTKG